MTDKERDELLAKLQTLNANELDILIDIWDNAIYKRAIGRWIKGFSLEEAATPTQFKLIDLGLVHTHELGFNALSGIRTFSLSIPRETSGNRHSYPAVIRLLFDLLRIKSRLLE